MTLIPEDYRHLTRAELVDKIQEQGQVIKALTEENTYLRSEMDRYHRESRDSAKVVGGILNVLRDNGVGASLDWGNRRDAT